MSNFKKLPQKARTSMIIGGIMGIIIVGIIICAIRAALIHFNVVDTTNFWVNAVSGFVILAFLMNLILEPTVGYYRHRYKIDDISIEKITGIFGISHEIVPIRRMLQVEISEGPIDRVLKLSTIKIITAGGSLELEYVKKDEAYEIAQKLKKLINNFVAENGGANGKQS